MKSIPPPCIIETDYVFNALQLRYLLSVSKQK